MLERKQTRISVDMKRTLKRKLLQAFDLSFYKGSGYQYLWLAVIMILVFIFWWGVGALFDVKALRVAELMLDPGSFAGSDDEGAKVGGVWIQLFITLAGAAVFTSFIINVIGNSLGRRLEAFVHGQVTYRFRDHVLILGSNGMLVNILKSLMADSANKGRDIVVLTGKDVEKVREYINSYIPDAESKNIYVVYGDRTIGATLESVEAKEAKCIYILGEDDEQMHDALNLSCWASLKEVCADAPNPINCFLVLERISTEHVFYYKSDSGSFGNLRLTVINELENAAQRVLVSREYEGGNVYPALDRDGITKESEVNVHFVIVGMTQMAYAMAMTAAHVCHFPNFATKGKRTKITFVQEGIRQEMDFFRGHFSNMMNLSYARYIGWDKSGMPVLKEFRPKAEYLTPADDRKYGFLDVEWEFLDGGIETEPVRKYLAECAAKDGKSEYLTIAICDHEPEANVAASLYMPSIVYEKKVPILVYQKSSGEVLKTAKRSDRFAHIYPFGMKSECYDAQYKERLKRAKRINYLYNHTYDYVSMPEDASMDASWFEIQYAFQQSNLYAANSIPFKLRSIGMTDLMPYQVMPEMNVEELSIAEHNRWNQERLIVGFKPFTYEERMGLKQRFESDDAAVRDAVKKEHNDRKKKDFMNKDIAPYGELLEGSKDYDRAIVRNLLDVMR